MNNFSGYNEYTVNIEDMTVKILTAARNTDKNGIMPPLSSADCIAKSSLHTHSFTELFICYEGEMTVRTLCEKITLHGGELLIMPAGIPHVGMTVKENTRWNTISFMCIERHIRSYHKLYNSIHIMCSGISPRLYKDKKLCFEAFTVSENLFSVSPCFIALHFTDILCSLKELPSEETEACMDNLMSETDLKRIVQLENVIANDFMKDIHAEDTARKLFISVRQMQRIVKKRYGTTFHQILISKRIDAAARLLLDTEMSVDEIINAVGFSSKSAFYENFYKIFSVTPKQYRKFAV